MKNNNNRSNGQRIAMEDMLKEIYAMQLAKNGNWDIKDLACQLDLVVGSASDVCSTFVKIGWAQETGQGKFQLTQLGSERAVELIRAHRLWEQYLASHEGYPLEKIHAEAHQREHNMSPEEVAALDENLGIPLWDPHGHAIPDKGETNLPQAGEVLSDLCVPGNVLRVVSIDDHPQELLAQFVALGIVPGAELTIMRLGTRTLEIEVEDRIIPLALSAAQHIFAVTLAKLPVPLGQLEVGQHAQIYELKGKGRLQRRLLSMGFVPGALVSVVRQAPFGDPVQYRIKKANIALRRREANMLMVTQ
jgi:Fe2+ transport system protein FeoA/Mn-dependent DtxR family transcriptional regulator